MTMLFLLVCASIACSSTATATTLTNHIAIPHGVTEEDPEHVVRVTTVAPGDDDDDGCRNASDSFSGPGCSPPSPVVEPVESVAPELTTTSLPPPAVETGSAIPSYITECESGGDYGAVNPSSGAYGAYQIMPSTADAYGCDLNSAAGQDACAGDIYADVGSSAWSCG